VPGEQTLAYGSGVFTHYTDPTWVLESLNSGATLQLRRTAPASPPNPPNVAPVNYLVFGMLHPQGCTGSTAIGTANGGLKQVFRYADDPPDTLTATMCMEGSFVTVSVQDQQKRTELHCTRIAAAAIVCQKTQ
jgi:hypothetical protein